MKKILLFLLLAPAVLLLGEASSILFQEEDPTIFHHVNLLTGQLNLHHMDAKVKGEIPLFIDRGYTSFGAQEKTKSDFDLRLKELRGGFLIQGGWNFYSYTNLLLYHSKNGKMKAYLAEPGGGINVYELLDSSKQETILAPKNSSFRCFGSISAKNLQENFRLHVQSKEGVAVLYLPDGGKRTYFRTIHQVKNKEIGYENVFYRLVEEVCPSGHIIDYFYDRLTRLSRIEAKSPNRKQIYSWMNFNLISSKPPFKLAITTSDGKKILYQGLEHSGRDYISYIKAGSATPEIIRYEPKEKNGGLYVNEVLKGNSSLFSVEYYKNSQEPIESYQVDKVKAIYVPDPNGSGKVLLAKFQYTPSETIVHDDQGIKTSYIHDVGKLRKIDRYDRFDQLHSSILFIWERSRLKAKVLVDPNGRGILSKTFSYDQVGNVIQETLYGDLTGKQSAQFKVDDAGALIGAEKFSKYFTYEEERNNVIEETEDDGLTVVYAYLPKTNLVTKKLTKQQDKITLREFFQYDEHHLLIKQVLDDGKGADLNDLDGVQYQKVIVFKRDPLTGQVLQTQEFFLDPKQNRYLEGKTIEFTYNSQKQVCMQKEIFPNEEKVRIYSAVYDDQDRIIKKIDPLKRISTYSYDQFGNLIEEKEVGKPPRKIAYDRLNRPIKITIFDQVTETKYDLKGNPIQKIDERGFSTFQEYDEFGNCIRTQLPEVINEKEEAIFPIVEYSYDLQGNLKTVLDPNQLLTSTVYTSLRKPKKVIFKDGSSMSYFYTINGLLQKTIHQDQSYTKFKYDHFHRLIKEETFSKLNERLVQEEFFYEGVFLKAHRSKNGILREFTYDCYGNKIEEKAQNRTIRFTYDLDGRIQEEIYPTHKICSQYNDAGLKIREVEEDLFGKLENDRSYVYNDENLLIESSVVTTQGVAKDFFDYDEYQRLVTHIDPFHSTTTIHYHSCENGSLFIKEIIDPIGQKKLEYYDAMMRKTREELLNEKEQICGKQEMFYDAVGNLIKVRQAIYEGTEFKQNKEFSFFYDEMGRKITDLDEGKILKEYGYDLLGHLTWIRFPSGKTIHYEFDAIDQLRKITTGDQSICYEYLYEVFQKPSQAIDQTLNRRVERKYNCFGEVIYEKDFNLNELVFSYDEMGRPSEKVLPDRSCIRYEYGKHLKKIKRIDSKRNLLYQQEFLEFGPLGEVIKEKHPGLNFCSYHLYDSLGRKKASYNPHFFQEWQYDALGCLKEYENSIDSKIVYSYDAIGQLKQEGKLIYQFDSFGNPIDAKISFQNELLEYDGKSYVYDLDGNQICKIEADQKTFYHYDALNRLVKIENGSTVTDFFYDPFSRLIKIQENGKTTNLLYDLEEEIGTIDDDRSITALKVMGSNNQVLTVELDHQLYLPLVDLQGNIRAIFDQNAQLVEQIKMTSFGERSVKDSLCPWGFSGKRRIGKLYLFRERLYDPETRRWITKDPIGFSDGYNLYQFVQNQPTNRIDLFGLLADDIQVDKIKIPIPIKLLIDLGDTRGIISTKGFIGQAQVDWVVACGLWHQLKFSPDELEAGVVNIVDHFHELLPKDGRVVGMITAQNGILTTKEEFQDFSHSIVSRMDESALYLGLHNPTEGPLKDIHRAIKEMSFIETNAVVKTKQFMEAISISLDRLNPDMLWTHVAHSEAGAIARVALENMHPDAKEKVKKQLKICAMAPAIPISKQLVREVENIYSNRDFFTGTIGRFFSFSSNYNIQFVKCLSKLKERHLFMVDHAFLGTTYQTMLHYKFAEDKHMNRLGRMKILED